MNSSFSRRLPFAQADGSGIGTCDTCYPGGARKLTARKVEKPWGQPSIPSYFGNADGRRIGEIWFEHPMSEDLPLLVKYIFTSERLSIQVHPTDEQARVRGLRRGKSECWFILDAEPGARIGLGLRSALSAAELQTAALDGSVEDMLDWRPVASNDFFFVPAGTVHAIGAGITLVEFQQNSNVTYRLYDYGRPRELHLTDGIAIASLEPYDGRNHLPAGNDGDAILLDDDALSLVRTGQIHDIPECFSARQRWVVPLKGQVFSDDEVASAGECLLLGPGDPLTLSRDASVLVAAAGPIR